MTFGNGLNVLYGPNDIGKSTLAAAIRAALLMQTSSKEADEFINWHGSGDPFVELVFESEPQRIWRVRKTFGNHPQAFLHESRDGVDFHKEAQGRDVDGRLSDILQWGVAPPGAKGRPRGLPVTFLTTALLAEQDQVAAIFGKALSGDSDESGKKRLIEALQAAAEDPLFKSVLHVVQAEFDRAFSSSGQRRRGKDSLWIKVREQIQNAEADERQSSEQLQRTTSIETELKLLFSQGLELEAVLEKALAGLACAEEAFHRVLARAEIAARLRVAQDRLDEIKSAIWKLSDTRNRHADLSNATFKLAHSLEEALNTLAAAGNRAETVKEEVRVRSADRDRELQEKRIALEQARSELLAAQVGNTTSLNRVRTIESIAGQKRTIEATIGNHTRRIADFNAQHSNTTAELRDLDKRESTLLDATQLIRGNVAKAGIDEAERALAQISTWRDQAQQHRNAAITIESMLERITLPAVAELDFLTSLERQLQIARASVGVGLYVEVRPKRELRLAIRRDDGDIESSLIKNGKFDATARSEIRLEIDDVAEISLSGGAASARAELARLQMRWITEADPVLKNAGLTSLDDVIAAVKVRTDRMEEIRKLHLAAAALDQRVMDQRDWVNILDERRRELSASEELLAGKDRNALKTVALKLGINEPASIEGNLKRLRAQRPALNERERSLEGEQRAANALSDEKQKEVLEVGDKLLAAKSEVAGYTDGLLTHLLAEQSQLAGKLKATGSQLQTLDANADKGLVELRSLQERAENEHRSAADQHRAIADELSKGKSECANVEGELKILGELVAKLDESTAAQAIDTIREDLNNIPKPDPEVTEELLDGVRAAAKSASEQLRGIKDSIQSKRGALEHVGGQVAKERAEIARETLSHLREQEQNLEIDYDAWALLRKTLLEAEQEEGVHLGRVLGDPIVQRFTDLTAGRYGRLSLGPDLETDTISVAGEGRSVSALSVGTRDQLSLIFRLTLAEQLGSAVVLDDQLTQSDAQRMVWLRNLLTQTAATIQILVFTCRPADYLVFSELQEAEHYGDAIRSIDLGQVIEKSGWPPEIK